MKHGKRRVAASRVCRGLSSQRAASDTTADRQRDHATRGDHGSSRRQPTPAAAGGGESLLNGAIKCDGQYKGKEVHIFSPVRDSETDKAATRLRDAYAPLEECTGVKVVYDGTDQFETEIKVRIDGGNPPDLDRLPAARWLPRPDQGGPAQARSRTPSAKAVQNDNVAGWPELATVDGKVYGVPARANVKSMVWYSPAAFKAKGYEIPTTLEELTALSDKIVADGGTPWCVGIESGVATGWVITDWFEDIMLRVNGPEVYDQWVQHEIPFNDPKVKAVADAVGAIVKNPDYIGGENARQGHRHDQVPGGRLPDPRGQVLHAQAGQLLLDHLARGHDHRRRRPGRHLLLPGQGRRPEVHARRWRPHRRRHRQAGDVRHPARTRARPTTSTRSWRPATPRCRPARTSTPSKFTDPVIQNFADLLKGADVFRFDGADMMPAAVGSGAFWKEATAWIAGGSTDDFLNNVENAWSRSAADADDGSNIVECNVEVPAGPVRACGHLSFPDRAAAGRLIDSRSWGECSMGDLLIDASSRS